MSVYLIWILANVWAVSKTAAFVTAEKILSAVNDKLPLDQQITYRIGFRLGRKNPENVRKSISGWAPPKAPSPIVGGIGRQWPSRFCRHSSARPVRASPRPAKLYSILTV
jgi:hypothetical protein